MSAAREQSHTGFLRHRQFRWAKVALALCLPCIAAYVWHEPPDGPNGGTWLGYTLGAIGALLILFLTWLGVRKRRYRSGLGTLKGWTSAHVYLGLALIPIATLHAGFQFGANVHTLAYGLMCLVIVSGLYGVIAYARLPQDLAALRQGTTREAWIEEVLDLNEQALKLGEPLGPEVHRKLVASIEKVRIGGSLRQQLYGAKPVAADDAHLVQERIKKLLHLPPERLFDPSSTRQNTVAFMASQLGAQDRSSQELQGLQQLLDLIGRRNALVTRINRDIAMQARLQIWLLVHVPLTFALLAALVAHIVSVFFYW